MAALVSASDLAELPPPRLFLSNLSFLVVVQPIMQPASHPLAWLNMQIHVFHPPIPPVSPPVKPNRSTGRELEKKNRSQIGDTA